jgi:transketolase
MNYRSGASLTAVNHSEGPPAAHTNSGLPVTELHDICRHIRTLIVDEIGSLGVGHLGGSLSIVEALVCLYYGGHLRADPHQPGSPGRDRFILSKGHAGPALYAVLADRGYFPLEWLRTLNQPHTKLPSHPDMHKTPGVEMTTGSLGQGFSAALGAACAARVKQDGATIFTLIGDGESQEGQIWEAALYASQVRAGNLIAFTDYNRLTIDGTTDEINSLEPLDDKWRAFGWHTITVDGHDVLAIDEALAAARLRTEQPSMIILATRKGKGLSFIEAAGRANHNMAISDAQVRAAISELDQNA